MAYGRITPLYVYRMLGGQISMEDIERGLLLSELGDERVLEGSLGVRRYLFAPQWGKQNGE